MPTTSEDTGDGERGDEHGAATIVKEHFRAINDRDREAVAALHSEDVVIHSRGRDLEGIEEVIRDWWAQLEALPDLRDEIEMLLVDGDRVAVRYKTSGTHEGEFLGIEPTQKQVEITSMAVVRIENGELVEWWNHPDRFGLFEQLGLIESPLGDSA